MSSTVSATIFNRISFQRSQSFFFPVIYGSSRDSLHKLAGTPERRCSKELWPGCLPSCRALFLFTICKTGLISFGLWVFTSFLVLFVYGSAAECLRNEPGNRSSNKSNSIPLLLEGEFGTPTFRHVVQRFHASSRATGTSGGSRWASHLSACQTSHSQPRINVATDQPRESRRHSTPLTRCAD